LDRKADEEVFFAQCVHTEQNPVIGMRANDTHDLSLGRFLCTLHVSVDLGLVPTIGTQT
jgi:hypothetical protein